MRWVAALRRATARLLWLPAGLLAISAPATAQDRGLEYAIKATFLYKFAPFVDWPSNAFGSAASPFTICLLGNDPVAAAMDQVARGQRVGARTIAIRHLSPAQTALGCHVLYVAEADAPSMAAALSQVRGAPVLTVTDAQGMSGGPAIVHFVVEDNKVRFDIDDAQATRNGLTISSKLLSLARTVSPRPPEAR